MGAIVTGFEVDTSGLFKRDSRGESGGGEDMTGLRGVAYMCGVPEGWFAAPGSG